MIIEMSKLSKKKYNLLPITRIINKYFLPLKARYNWGPNPFYYLAGKHRIHPTYIQEMLTIKMDDNEILEAIRQLKQKNGSKYDVNLVKSEFQKPIKLTKGNWIPKNKLASKEVLLISSGPKLVEYKKEIEKFINKNKPYVIALNTQVKINKKLIDLHVACNPLKFMGEVNQYKKITSPLVAPITIFSDQLKNKLKKIKVLNFGIGLKDGSFKFYNTCANIPKLYTVAYALSIVASGKAKKVFLAGFDGYQKNDRRLKIVDEIFQNFQKTKATPALTAITPSAYNIQKNQFTHYDLNKNLNEKITKKLKILKRHNVVGIKQSLEDEGATFDDLKLMRIITNKTNLNLNVKIGGCEAKNDIFFCKKIKTNSIVAPMIESKYALKKFIQCAGKNKKNKLFFNLETNLSLVNLSKIMKSKEFKLLDGVVIGRSDLAGSLSLSKKDVNKKIIFMKVFNAFKKIKSKKKK